MVAARFRMQTHNECLLLCKERLLESSMSRRDYFWDDTIAESFFLDINPIKQRAGHPVAVAWNLFGVALGRIIKVMRRWGLGSFKCTAESALF